MLLILEFNFVSLASTSFLSRAFSCCNSAIVLSPMFNGSRGELGVGDEAPIEDSLDAGLNFGEWFSSALNEYILGQSMIYKPFPPCNTLATNPISQRTVWAHIDKICRISQTNLESSFNLNEQLFTVSISDCAYCLSLIQGAEATIKATNCQIKFVSRDCSFQYLPTINFDGSFHCRDRFKQRMFDNRSSAPSQRLDFPVKLLINCPPFDKRTEINGKYVRFVTEDGVFITVLSAHGW